MALYALCLAGSTYIAPLICGFIAEYQDWKWVFYWPAIFLGVVTLFLFFFMEETKYALHTGNNTASVVEAAIQDSGDILEEKETQQKAAHLVETNGLQNHKCKSLKQRPSLIGPSLPNNMFRRVKLMLRYLTWPVVFYSG